MPRRLMRLVPGRAPAANARPGRARIGTVVLVLVAGVGANAACSAGRPPAAEPQPASSVTLSRDATSVGSVTSTTAAVPTTGPTASSAPGPSTTGPTVETRPDAAPAGATGGVTTTAAPPAPTVQPSTVPTTAPDPTVSSIEVELDQLEKDLGALGG